MGVQLLQQQSEPDQLELLRQHVDLGDLLALWGARPVLNADMNQDGKVNGADRSDILGTSAAPATRRRHREQEASLSGWKISVRLGLILSR